MEDDSSFETHSDKDEDYQIQTYSTESEYSEEDKKITNSMKNVNLQPNSKFFEELSQQKSSLDNPTVATRSPPIVKIHLNGLGGISTGKRGPKKVPCPYCSKPFTTSNLRSHIRQHTGERPFACHLCPKTYAQKANLISHLTSHAGEKPYKCNICEKTFLQVGHLSQHKKKYHPEAIDPAKSRKKRSNASVEIENNLMDQYNSPNIDISSDPAKDSNLYVNAEFPFLQPQSEVSSSNQSMIVDTDKQIEINNNNFEFYQAPNYKFNPYTPSNEPYHHYPYWSQPNFQPNFAPQPDLTFLIPFYPQNDQPQTPSGFEKYSIPATKNTPIFPQFEGQTTPSIVNETAYPPLPQNNNQSLPINNQNLGESPSMFSNLFQRATEELSQNQIHLQQLQQEEHNVLIQQNDHANQPIYLNQRQNIIQPFTPSSRLKSIVKPHLQRNNSQRMEAIQNRNHSNIKTQLSSQIHSISSNESGLQNSNTMPFSTQQLQMLQQKSLTLDQPNLF